MLKKIEKTETERISRNTIAWRIKFSKSSNKIHTMLKEQPMQIWTFEKKIETLINESATSATE